MEFTTKQNKKLTDIYPYLVPTNVWTDEPIKDYDYSYLRGESDLPQGWFRLFLLYCKHIKKYLVAENIIDKFHFTQIKEKYGTMRLYNNLTTDNISYLTILYEEFSKYVCENCGEFATHQTTGWISSFCDNCVNTHETNAEKIKSLKACCIHRSAKNQSYKMYFSYKNLRKEYNKIKNMSQEEFYNYLVD